MGNRRKDTSQLSKRQFRRRLREMRGPSSTNHCRVYRKKINRIVDSESWINLNDNLISEIQDNNDVIVSKNKSTRQCPLTKPVADLLKPQTVINSDLMDDSIHLDYDKHTSLKGEKEKRFREKLASYAIKNGVNHVQVTNLLALLRTHTCFKKLPKAARALLSTPRKVNIIDVSPGKYCHFGLARYLYLYLEKHNTNTPIHIQIGIDGLPLSKSGKSELWPIMGCIVPSSEVFLIGCYHGSTKPASGNEFLELFVKEAIELATDGFIFDGAVVKVVFHSLVADAPAKSFVTATKGHSGYSSCSKCNIHGEYLKQRVCFPGTAGFVSRSNEGFANLEDDEHHSGYSILNDIPNFGMISQIPLDYMHLVCIGVVKRMIALLKESKEKYSLSATAINVISNNLVQLREHIPKEFARKPRSLQYFNLFKATELRQILLYTGPIIFRKVLEKHMYRKFMRLHVAMRILSSQNLRHLLDYAEFLLYHFVQSYEKIFSRHLVTFNVHGLLHLTEDVRKALGV